MRHIQFTLFADGPTDRALLPVLGWLIRETHRPDTIAHEFLSKPELRSDLSFTAQLQTALDFAPCDILFIHRDAEKQDPQLRYDQIGKAIALLSASHAKIPHVCVVPVRMTEAWLLADERAIRKAAANERGTAQIDLPKLSRIESLPDPKAKLHELLRAASGKNGRRLASFDTSEAAALVPGHMSSFAPLRQLGAFKRLEADLRQLSL